MFVFLSLIIGASAALADRPVTQEESDRLQAALKEQGCSGGNMEFDDGEFEVERATCADGKTYDLEFDSSFRLIKKKQKSAQTGGGPAGKAVPKLVLFMVIDGFPQDQLVKYYDQYAERGFKLFLDKGAWYGNNHYSHATTYTGVGHATLLSCAHPYKHGVVGNDWIDKKTGKRLYSTEDARFKYLDEEASTAAPTCTARPPAGSSRPTITWRTTPTGGSGSTSRSRKTILRTGLVAVIAGAGLYPIDRGRPAVDDEVQGPRDAVSPSDRRRSQGTEQSLL
jgi:hypothetical protein